jgi:acyl dehydratase
VLDGDVTALRSFEARFAGPVYPGETLITEGWRRDATLYLRTTVAERATPALAGGRMEIR